MLKEYVGERTEGLLFRTSSGAQLLQTNVLRDSLHPILTKLEHVQVDSTSSGVSGSRT